MDKMKEFKKIVEKTESDKVLIITNHYQISGNLYECGECNKEGFINLINAKICSLDDAYNNECHFSEMRYDWLHINIDKIVAFSILQ